jgi:hypothetical protein
MISAGNERRWAFEMSNIEASGSSQPVSASNGRNVPSLLLLLTSLI